jgi:hypothetical protein
MVRAALGVFIVAIATGAGAAAEEAARVAVQTIDGRELSGVVDARTTDSELWIRSEQGAIVMASGVAWDAVASAAVDGQTVDASTLRERSAGLATEDAPPFIAPGGHKRISKPLGPGFVPRVRIRSLQIVDACLVNLDRDVEPDGLSVTLAAIDDEGRPAVVRGSLTARLFGEKRPNDAAVVAFPELDHWTQPVALRDFVDGMATYELRFRGTAPEWQYDLLPDAVLDVTLGAFGQGNYAASMPVLVRQFNPLRDHKQLRYGSRFLPNELRGREPSSSPTTTDGLWLPSYFNDR